MMGISSAEYAFTSAEDTLHDAHLWNSGHIFWLMGVWVFFQAAVAFPAGQLRESGRLPARTAMLIGALAHWWAIWRWRSRRTCSSPTSASVCAAVSAPVLCMRPA